MIRSTDALITDLGARAAPVRRLAPPAARATAWLAVIAIVAGLAIWRFSDLDGFVARARHPRLAIELVGTLLTGVTAVVAAFHLSLPDRSRLWALAPALPLLLWLGASGLGCWRQWLAHKGDSWAVGESGHCFAFIVAISLPLAVLLFWRLRRARPINARAVTLVGALGVAGLAAFILQFFHPFEVTVMDLALHVAAVGVVLALSAAGAGYVAAAPEGGDGGADRSGFAAPSA